MAAGNTLLSSRCRPHRDTRQSTPLRKIALSSASYRSSNRRHAQLSPPRYRDRHRWMKIPSQEFRHRPEANEERPGDLSGLSRTLDRFSPLRWARSRRWELAGAAADSVIVLNVATSLLLQVHLRTIITRRRCQEAT
ncbi:hypothetical protein Bbelb_325600 [Branchiostoma belcheri]|nr:hypothetical protein Bbelb_325600 [Branchiostoma belcheri]